MKQDEVKKPQKASASQSTPQEFMVQIQCNEYFRKFKLKQRQKTVTLNMPSQREVEEWIYNIEYVKTKANLDIFNLNYAAFTLPSTRSKSPLVERQKMNQESFGHLIQREIHQQKQLQEPILKQLLHQKNPSFTTRSQPTVTLTQDDAHNGVIEVPESVIFLKNTLSSLYSVLTLKSISHIQTNACKSPLPLGISPTPTNGDAHYILPTVGEDNDSQLNYSFAQLAPLPQSETLQQHVSEISRIKRVADLRRSYGFPTGLDQIINKQDTFQQEDEESDDEDGAGSQEKSSEEEITGGQLNLRRRNSFIGEKGANMTRNSRVSIKGDSSLMSITDKANKMDDFSKIENAVPQDPEESLMSFIEVKQILTFEEESQPIQILKVFLPLKGQLIKDGAIVWQLTSSKHDMTLPDHLQPDKPKLKRRRQHAPHQSFHLSSSASVSHRHLLSHFQRQRAENSTALARVLEKARVMASSSMASMIVRKQSTAAVMSSVAPAKVDQGESKRRPSLLKGNLPHPRLEEEQLRKVRSVKSRVRFNDEEDKEGEGLVRDESVISIGQTMAIQEYQRFASQRGRDMEQVKTIQKHANKIHKSSPSISRDQSRIYDEEAIQHHIHVQNLNMSSTNEVDFCNVDDSEILDLQILATHRSLVEPFKVTRKYSDVKINNQVSQEPGEMYVQEEIQCIVINNPNVKNLKLSKGTKVYVNQNLSGFDVVQAMLLYQGDIVTVIVPGGILGRDLPRGVMAKPNLHIQTSSHSSQTQSQEDSKLLRQPSDQCIPKAVPNFNSFTTSRKSLVNDQTEQRSRPNPFHKFLQPIGHDSTVRSYQGDETINTNSRLELMDESSSLQIPEFNDPPSSKTSLPQNNLEFTLSRPFNMPVVSHVLNSDFESYLPGRTTQDLAQQLTSEILNVEKQVSSPMEQDQETPTGFGPSSSQPRLSRTQTMNRLMKMQMRKALKMAEKERQESPNAGETVGASLKVQERRMRRQTQGARTHQ